MERIDPDRLIQIRTARGLTWQQLRKSSYVSVRQIARIEGAEGPVKVREKTMERLTTALDVDAAVLAGEAKLPADIGGPEINVAKIEPKVLWKLRKRKAWSRRELAERARVSPQLVERVEKQAEAVTVRTQTLERLARAFGVEESVLSGEKRLEPATPTPEHHSITVRSAPGLRLAYDLVDRYYGASPKDLFVLAPALFVLLAEGSLDSRRRKLEQAREANRALDELGQDNPTLFFARDDYQQAFEWGVGKEGESIKNGDVLGRDVWDGHGMMQWGFTEDHMTVTPFADYLKELADNMDQRDAIDFGDMLLERQGLDVWGANPYAVCQGLLNRIAGDSQQARWALEWGNVRIPEIPEELMPQDLRSAGVKERAEVKERRIAWLESKLADDVRKKLEQREAFEAEVKNMLAQLEAATRESE